MEEEEGFGDDGFRITLPSSARLAHPAAGGGRRAAGGGGGWP